uniref:Uncharacterized protein n=1 Tax=Avena sativa TaxID=4498 RepID=A0ACD6AEM0_AVESA
MTRRKVPLVYIRDNKSHRETFQTRNHGLMKKAGELATLCDTKACVIIFPEGELVPQVFSSSPDAVAILHRFMSLNDDDRFMKTMDQECFLQKRKAKLESRALKLERDHEELKIRLLLHRVMLEGTAGLSVEELARVDLKVKVLLKSISDRIIKISGKPPVYQPSRLPVQAPTPHFTGGMPALAAQALTPRVTGAQTPIQQYTGRMHTIGAQAPLQQHETWLDLMRSQGGDLDALVYSGFNNGATNSAPAGLNNEDMMQPFDAGFGSPWGGAHPGPSSSSFPPM